MPGDTATADTPRDITFRSDFEPVSIEEQIRMARSDLNKLIENHQEATSMGRDLDRRRRAMSPTRFAELLLRRKSVLYTLLQLQNTQPTR